MDRRKCASESLGDGKYREGDDPVSIRRFRKRNEREMQKALREVDHQIAEPPAKVHDAVLAEANDMVDALRNETANAVDTLRGEVYVDVQALKGEIISLRQQMEQNFLATDAATERREEEMKQMSNTMLAHMAHLESRATPTPDGPTVSATAKQFMELVTTRVRGRAAEGQDRHGIQAAEARAEDGGREQNR
jgi:hypothetical protein